MGTGFAKKKKQAKQLQEQMAKMQEDLQKMVVTGRAPNDLVTVTLNGEHEVQNVKIKRECVDPDDIDGLEALVRTAYNDAARQLKEAGGGGGIPNLASFGL